MEWRKCGSCKRSIPLGARYQKCSVSTCRKHAYCSVDCWDLHQSVMNHKSAWAEEEHAPKNLESGDKPRRRLVVSNSGGGSSKTKLPRDVLIVASKLKHFVKEASGMNTSANVMEALSDIVRHETMKAVDRARDEGRKTLMDRDFQ